MGESTQRSNTQSGVWNMPYCSHSQTAGHIAYLTIHEVTSRRIPEDYRPEECNDIDTYQVFSIPMSEAVESIRFSSATAALRVELWSVATTAAAAVL